MIPFIDRYKNQVQVYLDIFGEKNYLRTIFDIELIWVWSVEYSDKVSLNDFLFENKKKFNYGAIKLLEKETNHDIVAVVTFLRNNLGFRKAHIGLTSQDLVSMAYSLMVNKATIFLKDDIKLFRTGVTDFYSKTPLMMGYTHGQKATPISTSNIIKTILSSPVVGLDAIDRRITGEVISRFGNGACGDGFSVAKTIGRERFSEWMTLFKMAIKKEYDVSIFTVSLSRQTDYYPQIVGLCQALEMLSLLVRRESQNIWLLASDGFVEKINSHKEAGSSAMPQKVNPIEFENAEGNATLCLDLCHTMVSKLMVSRLDRDLSDLTVVRNIGLVFGYATVMLKSFHKGVSRYSLDEDSIKKTINNSYETLAESANLILLDSGHENAYEHIKDIFMGTKELSRDEFFERIGNSKNLPEFLKTKIQDLII